MTYNNRHDIDRCLDSLPTADPAARLQVIVVDNASTDGTRERLHAWMGHHPGLADLKVIFNEHNLGFTRAINQALAHARAADILFLNPDTELPPHSLQDLRTRLHSEKRACILAPQFRNADGSVQSSCRRFPRHRDVWFSMLGLGRLFRRSRLFNGWKMGDFDHCHERIVEQAAGAFLLTTLQVVQKIGPWDESYPMFFSDVDWCQRARDLGIPVLFVPSVFVYHRQGGSVEQERPEMILSSHRSFIRYFWRTYTGPAYFLPNLLVSLALIFAAPLRYLWAAIRRQWQSPLSASTKSCRIRP